MRGHAGDRIAMPHHGNVMAPPQGASMLLQLDEPVTAESTAVMTTIGGVDSSVTEEPTRRIVEVDPTSDRRWDAFVLSRPGASIFHHSLWLRVLEAEYGQRPLGLAC